MASPSNSYIPEIESSPSIISEGETLPFSEVIETPTIKSSSNSLTQEQELNKDKLFSKAYIFKNNLFTKVILPIKEGEEPTMKISCTRYI
jgi:hypothetical protein